jgi:hypothetical protein
MSFKFIADTFSVARDSDHFLQLKTLKKPGTDDQVWVAIEIVGDSKYSRATSQSIIDTMEAVFFDHAELGPYERFEQALKEVNIIIASLKEKRKKSFGQINAIIAVLSGNELHLTQSNSAEAYLIRNNKFSMISEGLGSRSEDLFVNIASGELLPDDKLIFSTARLLRLATHSQIVQLFTDGVAEAIEAIRDLTINDESLSLGVVAIHAKFTQKTATDVSAAGENKYWLKLKQLISAGTDFVMEKTGKHKELISKFGAKKILIALAAVIIVLAISVSVLVQSRRASAIREEYKAKIANLYQDITTANTKNYANDSASANAILDKVDKDARSILDTNYFRPETLALLDKLQETRDTINHTNRVKDLAPYIDLSAKRADIKAKGILSLNDNFFAYEYNKLYEIILDQVLDPRTLDNTEIAVAGTSMEDQDALVFLTKSGRVIEYAKGQVNFANTEDQAWKSGVSVAAYGKYIYVLSPNDNQIYKYARLRDKYSSASAYNEDADVKNGISIAIDGDVYILKQGGNIIRLYKSKQQEFKIENLAVDLTSATKIFTTPELDNLYILDPTNKLVVIVAKSDSGKAKYYGQVVFPDLENVQDIFVDKNEGKLFVMTDKEIYKIDI